MRRKPVELPDIDEATFVECLVPIVEAFGEHGEMQSGVRGRKAKKSATFDPDTASYSMGSSSSGQDSESQSVESAYDPLADAPAFLSVPRRLDEWRLLADREFADFRAIELFLVKPDEELVTAARSYPKQMLGFLDRILTIETRHVIQWQAAMALMARIQLAMKRAEHSTEGDIPDSIKSSSDGA